MSKYQISIYAIVDNVQIFKYSLLFDIISDVQIFDIQYYYWSTVQWPDIQISVIQFYYRSSWSYSLPCQTSIPCQYPHDQHQMEIRRNFQVPN